MINAYSFSEIEPIYRKLNTFYEDQHLTISNQSILHWHLYQK